ncbi:unnamed protein product [Rhizoctonia solani]|uniref:Protein kinase domain-containing protein n=1 Tax=Rhizoctonia solani TaxID=456999 RepID=A0A8H2WVX7_9AGAM|nr:unnamed protein product [Rhizoctonia solani]
MALATDGSGSTLTMDQANTQIGPAQNLFALAKVVLGEDTSNEDTIQSRFAGLGNPLLLSLRGEAPAYVPYDTLRRDPPPIPPPFWSVKRTAQEAMLENHNATPGASKFKDRLMPHEQNYGYPYPLVPHSVPVRQTTATEHQPGNKDPEPQAQFVDQHSARPSLPQTPMVVIQNVTELQSALMTPSDCFQSLKDHGCRDLSSEIAPETYPENAEAVGGFGDIFKGTLKTNNDEFVAIKVLRVGVVAGQGTKSLKRTMREIYAWSKLYHQNVHELLGVTMFRGRLGMVSKWMGNGNLSQYLRSPSAQTKPPNRHELCVQIATGVAYIHGKDMVHGDLKAQNILISSEGIIKITDFDYSLVPDLSLVFSETTRMGGGTARWMAPELLLEETPCQRSKETDIYSLGMTFLEVITGAVPYQAECQLEVQVLKKLMKKVFPSRSSAFFPNDAKGDAMWRLLLRCWDHDPALRPAAVGVSAIVSTCAELGQ